MFIVIELVIIVLAFLTEGFSLGALQTITRFSGSLSLFLFSAIFLLYNKPYTITAWLSDRFYLIFTIVHGIHLAELLTFVYLANIELVPHRLAGGFMAYLFVFAMPFLQSFKMRGQISNRTYAIVETIFIYYVWLVFFLTYLPRVQGKIPIAGGSFAEHVALLGWVSTLLGMKLSAMIQFQKRR
ncbi:MAG TPA: hypothetical protein VE467_00860 [Chryseolinea sp.]|nr:hypothetical protein [Chryseolinea sp.]